MLSEKQHEKWMNENRNNFDIGLACVDTRHYIYAKGIHPRFL